MNKLSKKANRLIQDVADAGTFVGDIAALERYVARLEAQVKKFRPSKPTPRAAGDEHANWETAGGTTPEQNEARFAHKS